MVGLAGVLTLGLILRGYYDGKRLNELAAPQLAAIREVRLEASTAQHEMRHILSGGTASASQNVLLYLDQALWYLQSLLASDDHRVTKWKRSTNKVRDNRIPPLDRQLAEIKSYFQQHREKQVDPRRLDTVLKQNDKLFEAFWHQLDAVETDMLRSMSRQRLMFHVSQYALILFGGALTFAVAFTIRRYERQRAVDFQSLQKDIVQRKLTEQKLQTSYDFLKITNRHRDMQQMLDDFIATVQVRTGCSGCAVRILEDNGRLPYAAVDGMPTDLCKLEDAMCQDSPRSFCARVIQADLDQTCPNVTPFGSYYLSGTKPDGHGNNGPAMNCPRKACIRFGYRSLALIPIRIDQRTLGLIQIVDKREGLLPQSMVETLESAAMQLGPAIQRVRAEAALKTAYGQLEGRISERTEALSRTNEELQAEVEERRLVEQRLRKSRNTLQAVIDGIKDSLILVDAQMRIRMFNKAAAENFGFISLGKVIGRYCYEAVGQTCTCEGCKIPQAVEHGRMLTFERTISSETERMEQVTIYPVVEKDGRPGGGVMRIVDVTEEKRFEQQLIKNEKMASLGILVSSIAHEINNPNNFVTFNIPILKDYLEELIAISDQYAKEQPELELFHMSYPEFRKDILKLTDNIEHGAGRISTFVANLREFSQNNGDRQMVWLGLPMVVDKVLSICRSQIKKQIRTFEMDIPADFPLIYADQYSLEQILLNLIVNAIQAANKPDSFVKLSAHTGDKWQEHTTISLADNGSGINEKTMGRIFDPFFTTKSASEGTGLGLYVSHNLVQSLGGRLEVKSIPNEGSTFTVYLPDRDRRKIPRA